MSRLDSVPYYMTIRLYKYVRQRPFDNPKQDLIKELRFPLPQHMVDATSTAYSADNLEVVGSVMDGDIMGGAAAYAQKNFTKPIGKIAGAARGALTGLAGGTAREAAAAGKGFAKSLSLDTVGTVFQQMGGMAPNPNPSVTFRGPELRNFSYTWLLQPFDQEESQNIKETIKVLKSNSLPSNVMAGSAAILRYPALAQINFYPWDLPYGGTEWGWGEDSIIRIKKCFIDQVEVDYTPSNVPAFFEGDKRPVATKITLSFKEVEYMNASDWDSSMLGAAGFDKMLLEYGGNVMEQGSKGLSKMGGQFDDVVDIVSSHWFGKDEDVTKAEQ